LHCHHRGCDYQTLAFVIADIYESMAMSQGKGSLYNDIDEKILCYCDKCLSKPPVGKPKSVTRVTFWQHSNKQRTSGVQDGVDGLSIANVPRYLAFSNKSDISTLLWHHSFSNQTQSSGTGMINQDLSDIYGDTVMDNHPEMSRVTIFINRIVFFL
jgi:hypothetical protein